MTRAAPYSAAVSLAAALCCAFLVLPVLVIVYYAFSPTGIVTFPPSGVTTRWFVSLSESDGFRAAIGNSLAIAAIVTPLTLGVAIPTAIALVRRRFPGRALLNGLVLSPILIPGAVIGMAFLNLFSALGLGSGFSRIVVAMVCFTLPFAVRPLVAALHGLDPALEEAARNLGARPFAAFRAVTLPQLGPGLVAGALFIFVEAIDNFSIAVFLTDLKTSTIPVEAYGYIRDFDDPTVAALATVLIVQSIALVAILGRVIGTEHLADLKR